MKKFLILVMAIALTLSNTTPVKARNMERTFELLGSTVKISAEENAKAVTVTISNIQDEVVKISLESESGAVFFSEEVTKTPRYAKKLLLTELEDGAYKLVIRKSLTITAQPFVLTDAGVKLNNSDLNVKLLPVVKQKGTFVDVNYLSPSTTSVNVIIYDNEGKTVFEESDNKVTKFSKRFDLSKLPTGIYFMEVTAGGDTQYTNINL